MRRKTNKTLRPVGARRRGRQRGSILLLAIFFLILLSLLAVAFMKLVPAELQAAARHHRDTASFYAADAGIIDCLAFIEAQTENGTIDSPTFQSGPVTRQGSVVSPTLWPNGGWDWECTITPDPYTFGSGTAAPNPLRVYRMDCTAWLHKDSPGEQKYRDITAWFVQDSFLSKAYTVDVLPQTIWLNLATFRLEGDYMTNDELLLYTSGSGFSWDEGNPDVQPSFEGNLEFGELTNSDKSGLSGTVVDGARYNDWDNTPYDSSGDALPGRYERIAREGLDAFQSADFDMPVSSDSVAQGAWGSTPPGSLSASDTTHVFNGSGSVNLHVNATKGDAIENGLYLADEVDQIDFRVDGGQLIDVLTGTSTAWNSSDSRWGTAPYTGNESAGLIQPEGTIIDGGNQVVEIRDNGDRVDVCYVSDADVTIPKDSVVNGVTLSSPLTLSGTDNDGHGYTLMRRGDQNDPQVSYAGTGLPVDEYTLYDEGSNGVIYAEGDVNGVRGIVKGRRTVATRTDTGNSTTNDSIIRVNGTLTLADTPPWSYADGNPDLGGDSSTPWATDLPGYTDADGNYIEPYAGSKGHNGHPDPDRNPQTLSQLGLITYAVHIKGSTQATSDNHDPYNGAGWNRTWPARSLTNANSPLYIYASIFAGRKDDPNDDTMIDGGGFHTEDYDNSSLGVGRMEVYGSITEGVRQVKGLIDYSGCNYSYFYDQSLRFVQPPYSPSLPSYSLVSWEENSSFNY